LLKELGGIKRIQDQDIYIVTDSVEKGLKDLLRMITRANKNNPIVIYYLNKWNVAKTNMIPIIITQRENKLIIQLSLLILSYLTEYPDMSEDLQEFKLL
jgi:hypothetical protein